MAKRVYTVLVLPDASSPARVFHISHTTLVGLFWIAAVGFLALSFLLSQYVTLHARALERKQIRQETTAQNGMAEKVGWLEGELARLREMGWRIRLAVGLDKSERQPAPMGRGEADRVSQNPPSDTLKQRTERIVDSMHQDLATLKQEIDSREQSFRKLKSYLDEKAAVRAATPTILPVRGLITSGYGYRKSPFTGLPEFHQGLDIAAPSGTPILATADGVVAFVGSLASYGNVVYIHHGRRFATLYGHNSRSRVREGARVHRGDIIAYVGSTGRTTGPHVHYGTYVTGALSNPLKYLVDAKGLRFAGETKADTSS